MQVFRTSATCRASEGGKSEFLRVRHARDLDALPQKERKPRLKKTILRRNRVPPQCAIVRYIRGVVFEWRGCRSKSEKSRGRKSTKLFHPHPREFSLIVPPPKIALFGERTLSKAAALHGAQRRRKGVDFHGKGEPRFRATRREKRGKQQRSVLGFPLKQVKNQKAEKARSFSRPFLFVFHLNQARQNRTFAKRYL